MGPIFPGHGGRQGSAPKRPRCGSDAPKVTPDSPGVVNALNNDNERIRASFAHQMVMKGRHKMLTRMASWRPLRRKLQR